MAKKGRFSLKCNRNVHIPIKTTHNPRTHSSKIPKQRIKLQPNQMRKRFISIRNRMSKTNREQEMEKMQHKAKSIPMMNCVFVIRHIELSWDHNSNLNNDDYRQAFCWGPISIRSIIFCSNLLAKRKTGIVLCMHSLQSVHKLCYRHQVFCFTIHKFHATLTH